MAFEAPPVVNPYTKRQIIVVDARNSVAAATSLQSVDPDGWQNIFTVGLSPTGAAPVTHYWCGWTMTEDEDAAVTGGLNGLVVAGRAWLYDAALWTPDQVLADRGLKVIKVIGP